MFFVFNDTATTEIYTLSLHDALSISDPPVWRTNLPSIFWTVPRTVSRSEEHTSELQSLRHLVCRLLLEKTERLVGGRARPRPRPAEPPDAHTGAAVPGGGGSLGSCASRPSSLWGSAVFFFFLRKGGPRASPLFPSPPFCH